MVKTILICVIYSFLPYNLNKCQQSLKVRSTLLISIENSHRKQTKEVLRNHRFPTWVIWLYAYLMFKLLKSVNFKFSPSKVCLWVPQKTRCYLVVTSYVGLRSYFHAGNPVRGFHMHRYYYRQNYWPMNSCTLSRTRHSKTSWKVRCIIWVT